MPPSPENPYPSDQNIRFSIPYFRPDPQNVYPISDPVRCGNFSNSQWIDGVRDFVTPQTMFRQFFCSSRSISGNTRYSKNGIPYQTDGIYTLFQTKMAKSIPNLNRHHIGKWFISVMTSVTYSQNDLRLFTQITLEVLLQYPVPSEEESLLFAAFPGVNQIK